LVNIHVSHKHAVNAGSYINSNAFEHLHAKFVTFRIGYHIKKVRVKTIVRIMTSLLTIIEIQTDKYNNY